MRILEIWIKNYRQFNDLYIDLRDASGGGRDICFIGRNGTGKSTILEQIQFLLQHAYGFGNAENLQKIFHDGTKLQFFAVQVSMTEGEPFCMVATFHGDTRSGAYSFKCETTLKSTLKKIFCYKPHVVNAPNLAGLSLLEPPLKADDSLVAYCPPEPMRNGASGKITLNDAMKSGVLASHHHVIDSSSISKFWTVLTYLVGQRDLLFQKFLNEPENQELTVSKAKESFEQVHPNILTKLSEVWSAILSPAGLELNLDDVTIPTQLTDELEANLRLTSSGARIPYSNLSTGIRIHLFRIGHLYSLFFQRKITRSVVLIDEPENSLFPDFVYSLLQVYRNVLPEDAQLITATHDPLFAAQFPPSCRIILDFDDDGYVQARKGISPEGDDPNDVLMKDFRIRNLYGTAGLAAWDRFVELRKTIPKEDDAVSKEELIDEYNKIGEAYDFSPKDEIPK